MVSERFLKWKKLLENTTQLLQQIQFIATEISLYHDSQSAATEGCSQDNKQSSSRTINNNSEDTLVKKSIKVLKKFDLYEAKLKEGE